MPFRNFPENVRQLIFEHIDSVEQLEVLLFMRNHRERAFDSQFVSAELRSTNQSVLIRLNSLEECGLLTHEVSLYRYQPKSDELDKAVADLAEIYKIRPHKIFELIFSPLKKGRQFADAFVVVKPVGAATAKGPTKKGSDNG